MIDRQHIGYQTTATAVQVDPWRVRLFCQAIGETNPVHWDPAAAAEQGHAAPLVPPTFLKALESDHCSSALLLQRLNVPMQQVLHAEQRFSFHHPVLVGDVLEISRQITDLYDKRNGALQFIVVNTHFCRAGKRVAEGAQTILVRRPAQAPAAKVAA